MPTATQRHHVATTMGKRPHRRHSFREGINMATKDFQAAYMATKEEFFEFANIAESEIEELENTVHELKKENDFLKIEIDDLRA